MPTQPITPVPPTPTIDGVLAKLAAVEASEAAGHGADMAGLPGISLYPVGGTLYIKAAERLLNAAVAAGYTNPIDYANNLYETSPYEIEAIYALFVAAMQGQGFSGKIHDTTRTGA